MLEEWEQPLLYLGYAYAFKLIYSLAVDFYHGLKAYIWPYIFRSQNVVERFGEWALITGCSQGIGHAFVKCLAQKGMNIVLASRDTEALEKIAMEIREEFSVKTLVVTVDFSHVDAVDKVLQELDTNNIDLGILVNNVGVFGPHFIPFVELDKQIAKDMININIATTTMLCHGVLPRLLKKDKGAIINVCSSTSLYIMPYLSEYSATKHYVAAFTAGLQAENCKSNVVIQELDPGQVNTNMTKDLIELSSIEAPSPTDLVRSSLNTLGFTKATSGWWFHSLHAFTVSWLFPKWFLHMFLKNYGKKQYLYSVEKMNKAK